MNNMRKNGMVGVLENTDFDTTTTVHFSEWWNGEGLDFEVSHGKETKKLSLHMNEMHSLVTAMVATGMIDLDQIMISVYDLKESSRVKEEIINDFRSVSIKTGW